MIPSSRRSRQPTCLPWTVKHLVPIRAIVLGHALDTSTKLTYSSALNISYLNFIHLHSFHIDPTPKTLSLYATYMCHHIEPWSVDLYLLGICSELKAFYPVARSARASTLVFCTIKGFKRLRSKPIMHKRALLRDKLMRVIASFGPNPSYNDGLFITILLTGFHALLHLGELVWPNNSELQSYHKLSM
ncbi:hypothetical protein C2E23DRAFT_722623 [Lenzites betulinus]|nr:hypothetical protein C2E23DRAFT_722623 [Lenzites betulinus]